MVVELLAQPTQNIAVETRCRHSVVQARRDRSTGKAQCRARDTETRLALRRGSTLDGAGPFSFLLKTHRYSRRKSEGYFLSILRPVRSPPGRHELPSTHRGLVSRGIASNRGTAAGFACCAERGMLKKGGP